MVISGLIKDRNWRADRGDVKESMYLLNMIEEPAPEHQKDLWNYKPVKDNPYKPTSNTLEDIHGN